MEKAQMRTATLIFLGLFITFGLSWMGLVLTSNAQLGNLSLMSESYAADREKKILLLEVPEEGKPLYPRLTLGEARQGKEVYISIGCAYCHTQQVRRADLGTDFLRGWGKRQSYARDYIRQERVLLGDTRRGPDLSNVGSRLTSRTEAHRLLYMPRLLDEHSMMPSYSFLYREQLMKHRNRAPNALELPPEHRPPDGREIVPSRRAEALVSYLLSLKIDYKLPETLLNTMAADDEGKE